MNLTLEIENLTTGYRDAVVSRGLTGVLSAGTLTCLLGPNGAGKSTLLRTLSGFITPLGGSIRVMGRPLSDYSPRELAATAGVVLTGRVDATELRVSELAAAGRAPYTGRWGRLSALDREAVDRALKAVGMSAMAHRRVATLSDGELQRVMIAKALAQETPIILLDEPTAFLDYPGKVETMALLRHLAEQEGKTVFLSTHDVEMALQTAHSLWLLSKDLGLSVGTPAELTASGSLQRYFERPGLRFDAQRGGFVVEI